MDHASNDAATGTASTTSDTGSDRHAARRADDAERSVQQVLDAGDVVMVTTRDAAGTLSSRPLTVAEVDGATVRFLIDRGAPWTASIRTGGPLNASVANGGGNVWASLTGSATLVHDRSVVRRLWSKPAGAYFDGPDDPAITVLQFDVGEGEYWSAPGGGAVGRLVSLVGSAIGHGDRVNDHGPVRG